MAIDDGTEIEERIVTSFAVTLPLRARPKARARFDGRKFYDKKNKALEMAVRESLVEQISGSEVWGLLPWPYPVKLELVFGMQSKDKKLWGKAHTSRPDKDNLTKLVMDALNSVVWEDDCQVYEGRQTKVYSKEWFTEITVHLMEEDTMARQKIYEDGTRIAAVIDKKVHDKIKRLAEARGVSLSRVISKILEKAALALR